MAAAGGLLLLNAPAFAGGQRLVQSFKKGNQNKSLSGGWSCQGQSCVIYQEGMRMMLVNQYGNVAPALLSDDRSFVVFNSMGWTGVLTAQVAEDNNSIAWGDGTIWERNPAFKARPTFNLTGGWHDAYNTRVSVYQQNTLLFVWGTDIGPGLWIGNNSFVTLGGYAGFIAQVSPDANTINWSNNTAWFRDTTLVRV